MKPANSTNHWAELKEDLRHRALEAGFDAAAFAPAAPPPHAHHLTAWLANGSHAGLSWMARHPERRRDPRQLLPNLGVILVLGSNYQPPGDPMAPLTDPGAAWISAYARNRDYHDLLKKRLKKLARWLQERLGRPVDGRIFVDTAPVLEKPLAVAAGLGWQGKNALLVNRRFGCWLFLAEYFIALPLPADEPDGKDHCGDCRACLDACPTDALDRPYRLDAGRCLAYWSNEAPGAIPLRYRAAMGNRVFGCDDCLAVCPWNRFGAVTGEPAFLPRPALENPRLLDFVDLDDAAFRTLFRQSPVKRLGVTRFLRNLAVALGNWATPEALSALERLLRHEQPLVRGHAAWGVGRVAERNDRERRGGTLAGPGPAAVLRPVASAERHPDVRAEIEAAYAVISNRGNGPAS